MSVRSIRNRAIFIVITLQVASLLAFPSWVRSAPEVGRIVRVKVKTANVRKGPGTNHERIWRAPRNYPYKVIERSGKWLKVRDYEGYEEWIYGPLTDEQPAVVVRVKKANIRKGPGMKFPILFRASKGAPFLVLEEEGKWLKVRHAGGNQGWIFGKLVWGKFP
ncbi:MAG: SH3 domain-containing protein [Nitrospinota bacterium]